MTPQDFLREILSPGLARCQVATSIPVSVEAARLLLASALQEGNPLSRYQILRGGHAGAARGWWQFERLGGVRGVMTHPATSELARRLCDACHVRFTDSAVWRALEGHDALASGFARLLLWSDPRPLPTSEADGWEYYLRNWRPGKPRPADWSGNWAAAVAVVG